MRTADAGPPLRVVVGEDDVLLRAFEAEKAVYEVVYEARMRPSWVVLPMAAVARLAG